MAKLLKVADRPFHKEVASINREASRKQLTSRVIAYFNSGFMDGRHPLFHGQGHIEGA